MSSVYEELQSFLEMIEELEEIFLYVGLGVGVLAAFFLLREVVRRDFRLGARNCQCQNA